MITLQREGELASSGRDVHTFAITIIGSDVDLLLSFFLSDLFVMSWISLTN